MLVTSFARRVSSLAVFGLLPAAVATGEISKQFETEKEGIQLIGRLEDVARGVHYNANRLNSFVRESQISIGTHYHHLDQIRSLVNEGLRPALTRLTEIQPQLPGWQQDAINQMLNSAAALAADTNSAILAKREAGAVPPALNPEYKELLDRISEDAEALVQTSDAAGDYAAAHLQAVAAGLKVPR